jgi:hypothetical protein
MFFAAMVSILAIVLQLIPVLGITKTGSTIERIPWAEGTYTDPDDGAEIRVFMGLRALFFQRVVDGEVTADEVVSWTQKCGEDNLDAPEYCDTCSAIATDTTVVAILALITAIPQLSTDLTRSTRKFDVNCQKAFGILTGTLGGLTTLAALVTFNEGCYADVEGGSVIVPSSITGSEDLLLSFDWDLSTSFYCILFATLLKPVDVICHLLTPTPKFVQDGKREFIR